MDRRWTQTNEDETFLPSSSSHHPSNPIFDVQKLQDRTRSDPQAVIRVYRTIYARTKRGGYAFERDRIREFPSGRFNFSFTSKEKRKSPSRCLPRARRAQCFPARFLGNRAFGTFFIDGFGENAIYSFTVGEIETLRRLWEIHG